MKTILAVLITLCLITPAHARIFGKDDRTPMTETSYPWSAIGKIMVGNNRHCTGSLVSPNLVVAAAHCLYNMETLKRYDEYFSFHRTVINDEYQDSSLVKKVFHGDYIVEKNGKKIIDDSEDWAIFELQNDLRDLNEFFQVKELTSLPAEVTAVGYSHDFENSQTAGIHEGCMIRSYSAGEYNHDCDNTSGASGGPMFIMENGIAKIVAILSSQKKSKNKDENNPEYSRRLANRAIPSKNFFSTLQALLKP